MALFRVSTVFNIDLEFMLAPFHKRLMAWLVDLILIAAYAYLLLFFVYGNIMESFEADGLSKYKLEAVLVLFSVVLPVMLYHLLFEIFNHGRSPGKMLLGLRVLNKAGAAPSLSQYLLRWILCFSNYFSLLIIYAYRPSYLLLIIFVFGLVSIPDILTIAISKYGQRLGDLAANTLLIDTKSKSAISDTIYMDLDEEERYTPKFPEVLRLSDRDLNGIQNLLSLKSNKHNQDYILNVAYKIEAILQVKMNSDPETFLQTLMKDYNYLTQQSTN